MYGNAKRYRPVTSSKRSGAMASTLSTTKALKNLQPWLRNWQQLPLQKRWRDNDGFVESRVPVHFELLDSGVGAASIIFDPLPEGSRKPASTAPYRSTGSCVNSTPRSLRRSKASLQLSTNSTRGNIARFATISCKVRAVAASCTGGSGLKMWVDGVALERAQRFCCCQKFDLWGVTAAHCVAE